MTQIPTPGRIVTFFPPTNPEHTPQLPNGMTSCPAILTQGPHGQSKFNMTLFVANADTGSMTAWSIDHKDDAAEGQAYWDWPAKV